jgi:hypothetical protein
MPTNILLTNKIHLILIIAYVNKDIEFKNKEIASRNFLEILLIMASESREPKDIKLL